MTRAQIPGATNSNMVASSAGLRFLLMIVSLCGIGFGACGREAPPVLGLRLENPAGPVHMSDRVLSAPEGATFKLRLFGTELNGSWPWVAFAAGASAGAVGDAPDPCALEPNRRGSWFQVTGPFAADEAYSGLATVEVRRQGASSSSSPASASSLHHLCVRSGGRWASAGPDKLRVSADSGLPEDHIPAWGLAALVVTLLPAVALLRTVQLSLLWLDPVELYVLHSCGSEEEKRAAKRLEPIRRRGNFLVSPGGRNHGASTRHSEVQRVHVLTARNLRPSYYYKCYFNVAAVYTAVYGYYIYLIHVAERKVQCLKYSTLVHSLCSHL